MWNYRIIRKVGPNPIEGGRPKMLQSYDLHEVYYRKNGRPYAWTLEPISLKGFDSVKDLKEALALMFTDCCNRPPAEIRKRGRKEVLVTLKH